MDRYQNQKMNMENVVESYVDSVPALIKDSMPGFNAVFAQYKAGLRSMSRLAVVQNLNRKGAKKDKDKQRRDVIAAAVDIVARVTSYALNVDDVLLRASINYTQSGLSRVSGERFISDCRNIHSKAGEYLGVLGPYGVDALLLGAFYNKIEKFTVVVVKPKDGVKTKKGATSQIKEAFKGNDALLERMDVMVNAVMSEKPEFHRLYFFSRRIDKPGYRALSVRGCVVDEHGAALGFVWMICEALHLRKLIGKSGVFRWKNVKDGIYRVRFERAGYESVEVEIRVQFGLRNEIRVVMVQG